MASESAGITVWVMDLHRSKNFMCVATVNDMTVADFKKRVMFSGVVVEENGWSCEHHSVATLLREDGKAPVDTSEPLSMYADKLTNKVKFLLKPPPSATHAAVDAGAPSAVLIRLPSDSKYSATILPPDWARFSVGFNLDEVTRAFFFTMPDGSQPTANCDQEMSAKELTSDNFHTLAPGACIIIRKKAGNSHVGNHNGGCRSGYSSVALCAGVGISASAGRGDGDFEPDGCHCRPGGIGGVRRHNNCHGE
jgi:hypothetical protein